MTEALQRAKQRNIDVWAALGLAVAFLLLYLRTLCPTVYLGDDGEICTAIATGGVIHPPGYPLFSVLGRLFLALVPFGEPAYRIGFLVATAAAATVAVLYLVARELRIPPWSAASAAALFGAGHTFWNQSTRVEVYSLHTLLVCLCILAGLRYNRTGSLTALVAVVLAVTLGLAHHLTIVLIGPALLVLFGRRLCTDPQIVRRLIIAGPVMLIGPATYLLLMFWARAEPLQSWGRPTTLALLWNHASARVYGSLLQLPGSSEWSPAFGRMIRLYWDNFPFVAAVLPILGAAALWQRDRRVALGLLLSLLTVVGFNLCYRIDDIAPYYLAAWIVAAILLATGLEFLSAAVRRWRGAWWLAAALGPTIMVFALWQNWSRCDLSRATWVREFARQKLLNTDAGGVLISSGDDDTFPLWYVHDVLRVRPDVFHVDRTMASGVWSNEDRDPSFWYLFRLRRQGTPVPIVYPRNPSTRRYLASDGYLIDRLNGELNGRTACVTFFNSHAPRSKDGRVFFRWAAARYEVLPQGIVLRLQPRGQRVVLAQLVSRNQHLWNRMLLPDLRGAAADQDLDPDYLVNHYACMLVNYGGLREMAGDRAGAEALYRRVIAWAPGYRPAANALAMLLSKHPPAAPGPRRQALDAGRGAPGGTS